MRSQRCSADFSMKPPQFDKAAVRRSFGRAAASYDVAAVLQHEVCKRMNERLDLIKHQPALLLDAGCGTGNALPLLRARYPKARLMACDIALTMLQKARERAPTPWLKFFLNQKVMEVCGDIEALPLARSEEHTSELQSH
mgnify:FL=1